MLPEDYAQPRLFIISPENTGVQYLNEKQLEYFFSLKSNPKNNQISRFQSKYFETIHIVSRIIDSSELNVKRIIPNFNINLDIFKNEKYHKKSSNKEKYAVRSFIKHKNL